MSRRARLRVAIATYLVMREEEEKEMEMEEKAKKNRKRRQFWVREWIEKRSELGFVSTLYNELKEQNQEMYKNFIRMSVEDFDYLLELVTPLIQKKDTVMRKALTPLERLCVTLRYLATGDSYKSLMYLFRIPANTISLIIPEVCDAIYSVLKNEFLKVNAKCYFYLSVFIHKFFLWCTNDIWIV